MNKKRLLTVMGGSIKTGDYTTRVLATEPSNLIWYLPLNDLSGTAVVDVSGNSWNGVYKNTPTLGQPGIIKSPYKDENTSVLFNGTDEYITIDKPDLCSAFNGQEGAVSLWFKLSATSLTDGLERYIIVFTGVDAGNGFSAKYDGATNYVSVTFTSGGISRSHSFPISDTKWHNLIFRWSYSNNQFCATLDGINTSASFAGGIGLWTGIINHDKTIIGSLLTSAYKVYSGNLAHISLWNKFLSLGDAIVLSGFNKTDTTLHDRFTRVSTKSLYRDAAPADWLGRPVLCNNDGEWVMVYRQSTDHAVADASCVFHIRFSDDEGVTWSDADTLVDTTAVTGAPFGVHATNTNMTDGIIFRVPNGDLLFQVFEKPGNVGTFQYRSTDDGATWTDEGKILNDAGLIGGQDHFIIGTDAYITIMDSASEDGSHPYVNALYKSTDNGTNWIKVADITSGTDDSEHSIINTSGNNLLCIMKDVTAAKTFKYLSTDLGATWGSQIDITSQVGVLQRPRLRKFGSLLLLFGRDYVTSTKFYTVVYVSTDDGVTFGEKFYPDTGHYQDGGYCDILQKTDGKYYMLSYGGLTTVADIKEYIWS